MGVAGPELRRFRHTAAGLVLLFLAACGSDSTPPAAAPDAGGPDAEAPIGTSSVDIDTRIVLTHTQEAAIGDFLTDVFMAGLTKVDSTVDAVMINAGSIRGGSWSQNQPADHDALVGKVYPAGPLTDGDVSGWLPFEEPNTTVVLTLTGTQLRSVLERSAASLPPDLAAEEGGWFLHFAGIKETIDCEGSPQEIDTTQPGGMVTKEGDRIRKIEALGKVIYDADAGTDELAQSEIVVGVNSFVAGGGDGHFAFLGAATRVPIPETSFDFVKSLKDHIRDNSPIAPGLDGDRIVIVGTCGKPGTEP